MNEVQTTVTVLELKRLLVELKEARPDIYVRVRLLGEMWARDFMRIISVTGKTAILYNEISNEFLTLPNLSQVMQFEIDKKFQNFQPHFHYAVKGSAELE